MDTDDEPSESELSAWNSLDSSFKEPTISNYIRKASYNGSCLDDSCDFIGINGDELEWHLTTSHSKFVCLKCRELFPTDDARSLHFEQALHKVKQSNNNDEEIISCASCCFCGSPDEVNSHSDIHSLPFECQLCGDRFSRYSILKEHQKTAHAKGNRRMSSIPKPRGPRGRPRMKIKSRPSDGRSATKDNESADEIGHSSNDEETWMVQRKSIAEARRWNSRIEVPTSNINSEGKRKRTASFIPDCIFPGCNSTQTNGVDMDKHFQQVHHHFLCLDCYQFFKTKEDREAHNDRERRENRWALDYPCDYCCRSFDSQLRYSTHIKTHSLEVQCPLCDRRFSHVSNMKAHLSTNHRSAGGPSRGGATRGRKRRRSSKFSDNEDDYDMLDD